MPEKEYSFLVKSAGIRLTRLADKYRLQRERKRRGAAELRRIKCSDLVMFSPGNSGRTWLRAMITRAIELHYGIDKGPPIRFDNRHASDSRIPKIAITHNRWLPYLKRPRKLQECREYYQSKVLILVRNPLDTCVSQYFQWLHRSEEANVRLKGWPPRSSDFSLLEFLEHPDTGVVGLCRELNIWLQESSKIRRVMFVRYEDMREDPARELDRIMGMLDIPVSSKTIEDAVEFASFENMRLRETMENKTEAPADEEATAQEASNAFKSRRGKINGYLEYLSRPEYDHFIEIIRANLSPAFGYSNLPEIAPPLKIDLLR